MTARDGNTASFTYNFYGQRLTSTNLAGATDSFAYDANGLMVAETDAAGNMTTVHLRRVASPRGGDLCGRLHPDVRGG